VTDAARAQVSHSLEIEASAAEVWALIADFGAIDRFSPMVVSCTTEGAEGVGQRRILGLDNGTTTISRLEAIDHPGRTLTYRILETRLPLSDYTSTMWVHERAPDRCEVVWTSHFRPRDATLEEASAFLDEGLTGSLRDLRAVFASGGAASS
jgi:mxaD protein